MIDKQPEETLPAAESGPQKTTITVKREIWLAWANVARAAGFSMSDIAEQAFVNDGRIAAEMSLREKAREASHG